MVGAALAAGDGDRHDLGSEAALGDGRQRPLVAAQGVFVLLLAGDAALFGDRFGAHAHVVVVPGRPQAVEDDRVLHRGRAHAIAEAGFRQQVRALAHALHAAGDDQRRIAGADRVAGLVDRLEARGAHLVERGRIGRGRDARGDRRLPGRRLARAGLDDLAHDDLVDRPRPRRRERSMAARIAVAPSCVAGRVARPPIILPIGVRAGAEDVDRRRRCCSYCKSHLPCDDELQDFAGALADRQNFGIPIKARDARFFHVAVATVHLHGHVGGVDRELAGEQFGLRGGFGGRLARRP